MAEETTLPPDPSDSAEPQEAAPAKKEWGKPTFKLDMAKMFVLTEEKFETGILALDMILGGGYEKGDMIEVASESGVGKSTLMCAIARNCRLGGMKCGYLDIERGVKKSILTNMNLWPPSPTLGDPWVMYKPQTYQEADALLWEMITKHGYHHIFLDSITQLLPSSVEEGNVEDITIGVDARLQSLLLKKYKPLLRQTGCVLWLVNQVRTKMEKIGKGRFAKMEVGTDSAGGKALQFTPDVRLFLAKGAQLSREENTAFGPEKVVYGNDVWLSAKKNRGERPDIKVPMTLLFGQGVSNLAFIKEILSVNKFYTVGGGGNFAVPDWHGERVSIRGTEEFNKWIRANFTELTALARKSGWLSLTKGEVVKGEVAK